MESHGPSTRPKNGTWMLEVHEWSTSLVSRAGISLAHPHHHFANDHGDENGSWGESWPEYSAEDRIE